MITEYKKIAFYLRVSTQPQEFPAQLHALKEFCRRQGWPAAKKNHVFAEKGTGKKARRTQLDLMLQACREGHIDTVITYRADRLGNVAGNLHQLFEELERLKIRVIGVGDSIDSFQKGAAWTMFRGMIFSMAQSQRELIVERTISGLAAARAAGRVGGKPRKKDAQIAAAVALRKKNPGMPLRTLAKKIGMSPGYLSRVLRGLRPKA